jgi:hypothetical protein
MGSTVDAFAKYRSVQVPDSGAVTIGSSEVEPPLLSEMVLANMLNDAGRPVSIVPERYSSSLVGRSTAAMWVHIPRPRSRRRA